MFSIHTRTHSPVLMEFHFVVWGKWDAAAVYSQSQSQMRIAILAANVCVFEQWKTESKPLSM